MLRVCDLNLLTHQKQLITHLNCHVLKGECWAIFGKNGVGKSTLIRALAGLHPVNQGEVWLNNQLINKWDILSLAKTRSYLPQNQTDSFSHSVLQVVLSGRYPYGLTQYWETKEDLTAAYFAMDMFHILSLKDRDIRTLSGGERKRVALASIFVQDTPLLFLDEPVNALDLQHQVSLMKLIKQLIQKKEKTVVMVMHDLNLIHDVATHVLLINEDGTWKAGKTTDMMKSDLLSTCLGSPIEAVNHKDRTIYISG